MVKPVVSVVIPAYNEEKFIEGSLKSLQRQNFDLPYEIIVVDNNSTDNTAQLARDLGAVVVAEKTRGVCAARQAGTVVAQGEIIVSTDADTFFAPDWLDKIYVEFERNPKLVGLVGSCKFVDAPRWGRWYANGLFGLVHKIYKRTGKVKYLAACNAAFRKSAFRGYNTNLTQGGDEIDLLRQLQKQGPVKYLPYNDVYTSARRMHRGLFYNLFVTFAFYYLLDYTIGRRIGRSVAGSYEAIRDHKPKKNWGWTIGAPTVMILVSLFALSVNHASASIMRRTGHRLEGLEDRADNGIALMKTHTRWHRHSSS